jgi:hypothetical protein
MIPFQKIFTLAIRTFSKPMLAYLKKKHSDGRLRFFNRLFIAFGRKYHAFEYWVNYRIIKSTHKKNFIEPK